MPQTLFSLQLIGRVVSELAVTDNAPKQGDEGAPNAWLELNEDVVIGLEGIKVGDELLLLTWLHQAARDVLSVHPRGQVDRPLTGVFATRSEDRPNPIGVHRVQVLAIVGNKLEVWPLEAIHGTPIVDLKPVLRDER